MNSFVVFGYTVSDTGCVSAGCSVLAYTGTRFETEQLWALVGFIRRHMIALCRIESSLGATPCNTSSWWVRPAVWNCASAVAPALNVATRWPRQPQRQ